MAILEQKVGENEGKLSQFAEATKHVSSACETRLVALRNVFRRGELLLRSTIKIKVFKCVTIIKLHDNYMVDLW